jgi:hypothetical protein
LCSLGRAHQFYSVCADRRVAFAGTIREAIAVERAGLKNLNKTISGVSA